MVKKGTDYFLSSEQLVLRDYFDEDGKWLPRLAYEGVADGVATLDLQKYLNDGSSVTNYGAVGDGNTDDAAAIQEAINASDVVVFPPGRYYIASKIVINKPTLIIGRGATIKAKSDIDILRVTRTNNVILFGLAIEGWANETSFTGYPGTQAGISIEASHDVIIDKCTVNYCSGPGIIITSKHNGEYYPLDTYNVLVTGSKVSANNQGITVFSGPRDVWIVNNLIANSITNGVFTDDRSVHDTEAYPPSSVVIANNILRGNVQSGTTTQAAIAITATRSVVVSHNIIVDSGQTTSPVSYAHGILLSHSQSDNIATNCVVDGNIIIRPSRFAIVVQAATYNTIANNRILDPQYNAPDGANAAVYLTDSTLGSGSVQGANFNILQNNVIVSRSDTSDVDYGVKITSNCSNNTILHDVYIGVSMLAAYDLGTDNRIVDVMLDGQDSSGAGTNRPTSPYIGQWFFDTNLGYPIWWNGTDWVDATGTGV